MTQLNLLISKVLFCLRKRHVVTNALRDDSKLRKTSGRVLLYYKTDPLFSEKLRASWSHTNNSEIIEIIRIFHQLGFIVDVVDREASWRDVKPLLKNPYAIYLANAAGNSAPLHVDINREIDAQCRIYYASGPEPGCSNELVNRRHAEFDERTGTICIRRRVLRDLNFDARLLGVDAIFYIGNEFAASTFRRVSSVPMFRLLPSTSPLIETDLDMLRMKSGKSFLYFGGNGLICKGLDLVLEAFDGLSHLTLDICGPAGETDFWGYYRPLMARNPQIKFHGFVDVTGPTFKSITSHTAFNIFPSCSEGCATSVVTAMRRGVIPVVTPESGVDVGEFGCELKNTTVEGVRDVVMKLSEMSQADLKRRILDTYLDSIRYSMEGFKGSMLRALLNTLSMKGLV